MKRAYSAMLAALLAVSFSVTAWGASGDTIVYRTRTGECYHTRSCSYLSKSKIEITLQGAVNMGLRPCSRCRPPKLEATRGMPQTQTTESTKAPAPTTKATTKPQEIKLLSPAPTETLKTEDVKNSESPSEKTSNKTLTTAVIVGIAAFFVGRGKRKK